MYPDIAKRLTIDGLGLFASKYISGVRGFLVLSGKDLKNRTHFSIVRAQGEHSAVTANFSDIIVIDKYPQDLELIHDNPYVDLMYFHALPSLNYIIKCQQAGFDMITPEKPWRPEIPMPVIKVVNKKELLQKIRKGQIKGVNFGGGPNFFLEDWVNIDTRYGCEDMENILPMWLTPQTLLPFQDESISYIYSSHFFEHIDDQIADRLFKEASRMMKSGAILMIVVPDFEKVLEYCRKGDWSCIHHWGFASIVLDKLSINNMDVTLENLTAMAFVAYGPITNSSKYHPSTRWLLHGCPPVPREQLIKAIHEMGPKEFSRFLYSQVPPHAHSIEHVNAYTYDELKERLEKVGLAVIPPSGETIRPLQDSLGKLFVNQWEFVSMKIAAIKH